jgi:hypothetical protein
MTDFLRFDPLTCPQDLQAIPRFIDEQLLQIKTVLDLLRDGHIDVVYEEPSKPQQGDIRYADGSVWNPGSGEGIYFRNSAAAWVKL